MNQIVSFIHRCGFQKKIMYICSKSGTMTTAELKLQIFRQIDSLDQKRLEELYLLINKISDYQLNSNEWEQLTDQQQQGLLNALKEAEAGYLVSHEEVMEKAREQISNVIHD
jgi:predicted transcriptional regulator